jgi:hypothetical protein
LIQNPDIDAGKFTVELKTRRAERAGVAVPESARNMYMLAGQKAAKSLHMPDEYLRMC